MNNFSTKKLLIYIVAIVILFAVPIVIVVVNTDTLKDGNEFLFKVAAFDPYDMFRGNYLSINFDEDTAEIKFDLDEEEKYYRREKMYVTVKTNADGFAYFDKAYLEKPKDTQDYYETEGYYWGDSEQARIDTPTRYYMNENKSLDAEKVYDENIDNTYVKVRVKNGKMVIVGVFVDDVLIDTIDYVEK
ncbi:MAG: GDYXXLXY domain-containing protein [Clostridia bacterium]|nr:GDYXXLXY domain-containing protein [Clostridia bacterium]